MNIETRFYWNHKEVMTAFSTKSMAADTITAFLGHNFAGIDHKRFMSTLPTILEDLHDMAVGARGQYSYQDDTGFASVAVRKINRD